MQWRLALENLTKEKISTYNSKLTISPTAGQRQDGVYVNWPGPPTMTVWTVCAATLATKPRRAKVAEVRIMDVKVGKRSEEDYWWARLHCSQ
jgi:hypothetical protein